MTTEELLQAVEWIKATMIAVATGGPRINDVQSGFAAKYDQVAEELAARDVPNNVPYRDLWQWYGRWSGGDMPSYQSRRNFVNGLADELVANIKRAASASKAPRHEPTGWPRVDRTVPEVALGVGRNRRAIPSHRPIMPRDVDLTGTSRIRSATAPDG
jgi:hypothetical protein